MNDRLSELLAKYWTNRITSVEKAEMERLLLDHPDDWLKLGLMQQVKWMLDPSLSKEQEDKIADRIISKRNKKKKLLSTHKTRLHWQWKLAVAALLVVFISGTWLFLSRLQVPDDAIVWQQVKTTNGMKTTLMLSDGSKLWLNAGSALRYPESFNEKTREIYLTGEAYLKVKHHADRPFIIHTADMDIKVLGTELDVRAYREEAYSETSLIKGAVEVTVKRGKQQQQIYLRPKEKVVVKKASVKIESVGDKKTGHQEKLQPLSGAAARDVVLKPVKIIAGDLTAETAWKENTLVFQDEPLQSLAKRLERWYGATIIIEDSSIAKQRFTGRADNVSLKELMHILQMIKPFSYMMHGNKVVIE